MNSLVLKPWRALTDFLAAAAAADTAAGAGATALVGTAFDATGAVMRCAAGFATAAGIAFAWFATGAEAARTDSLLNTGLATGAVGIAAIGAATLGCPIDFGATFTAAAFVEVAVVLVAVFATVFTSTFFAAGLVIGLATDLGAGFSACTTLDAFAIGLAAEVLAWADLCFKSVGFETSGFAFTLDAAT